MIRISDTTPRLLDKLILTLFRRGDSVAGVIMGRRNTGKTDHGLYILEVLFRSGLIHHYASNIKIYETPPGLAIERINDLYTLENWASVNAGRKLYILDEAGKAIKRRTPMAKLNIEILDKLQTLRKYKLSLIMITPAERYIDGASVGSDVLDFVVVKPEMLNQKVADYYDAIRGDREGFLNVPGTCIKFDTWDIAPFTLKPPTDVKTFPSKAVEYAYKNAKEHLSAESLGIDNKQLNRYYKYAILYFVEQVMTHDTNKR